MEAQLVLADNILAIGQKLHIHWEEQPVLIQGTINDIEERYLAIAMERGWQEMTPKSEASLQISIAADHCVYRFTAIYQNRRSLSLPLWYVTRPHTLQCAQDRRFVRVPASLPLQVRILNPLGTADDPYTTTALNISGNGLCFISLEPIEPHRQVHLTIEQLPLLGQLHIQGEVCRCLSIDVPRGRIYHIGVCLEKYLSHAIQEKLIHCVFELQRSYLGRGLGRKHY